MKISISKSNFSFRCKPIIYKVLLIPLKTSSYVDINFAEDNLCTCVYSHTYRGRKTVFTTLKIDVVNFKLLKSLL